MCAWSPAERARDPSGSLEETWRASPGVLPLIWESRWLSHFPCHSDSQFVLDRIAELTLSALFSNPKGWTGLVDRHTLPSQMGVQKFCESPYTALFCHQSRQTWVSKSFLGGWRSSDFAVSFVRPLRIDCFLEGISDPPCMYICIDGSTWHCSAAGSLLGS